MATLQSSNQRLSALLDCNNKSAPMSDTELTALFAHVGKRWQNVVASELRALKEAARSENLSQEEQSEAQRLYVNLLESIQQLDKAQ